MSPALRELVRGLLEGGGARQLQTAADVESLPAALRAELVGLHDQAFGAGAEPPSPADLARMLDAILMSEDLLEKTLYWDRDRRVRAWAEAAAKLGWPPERLHEFDRWWRSSEHHAEGPL